MASGAEIGWDLDYMGSSSDRTFYNNYLKADYAADDAGVYAVSGLTGTAFEGLSGIIFDDGTSGPYNVEYPDAINPFGGGIENLTYDGTGYKAGVQYSGTFKVVNLGFPFEAVNPTSSRDTLMARAMNFFAVSGDTTIEIIVDNTDPGCDTVGSWHVSTVGSNYGENKYWNELGDGDETATWTAAITTPGYYQIYFWVNNGAYAEFANYTIDHALGSTDTTASQYYVGDGWHLLGTHPLSGTASVTVTDYWTGEGNAVVADAIRFLYHHPPPSDSIPPAPVMDLTAILSQDNLVLSWLEVTADTAGSQEIISHYVVYRGEDPYFDPGPGDSIAGVAETTYVDSGVAGTVGSNHFYLVRAVDAAGNKSANSRSVGEFDRLLSSGP